MCSLNLRKLEEAGRISSDGPDSPDLSGTIPAGQIPRDPMSKPTKSEHNSPDTRYPSPWQTKICG